MSPFRNPALRIAAREIGAFLFFLLLTVAFTWPLAIRLTTATSDLGDPLLNTWILDWDLYASTHDIAQIYQAPVFYPGKFPLAYSENLFGIALAAFPFYLAGCTPLAIYNLMVIFGFAFCGYGAWVLVRTATGSAPAALIAGVLYAFVPFRFDHLPHLQILWAGWLPLIVAALIAYWRRPSWWMASGFGAALLMNGLCNIHYFLFGTLATAVTIFVLGVSDRRTGWRFWLRLAVAGGLAVALMVPVLWPYKVVSEMYKMRRDPDEVLWGSATWTDWLTPAWNSRTYGDLIPMEKTQPERHLFPGLFVLFLTAAALVLGKQRDVEPALQPALQPAPRWPLRLLDIAIVALAIVSYWGAIAPKFVLRIGGLRILSVSSSDLPFTFLLVLTFIRLTIRLPEAWRGGLRLPPAFWIGVLWIGIGVVGSFGVHGFLHSMLYHRLEAFQGLRVPARWASIAYVGLAVTAGFGAAALTRRRRWLAFAALLAVAIFDMRPRIRWEHAIPDVDPVYAWLRDAPYPGAFLELPIEENDAQFLYMLSDTAHHRLTLNGTSGYEPPEHWHLRELGFQKKWDGEFTSYIEKLGCSIVIVHDDWLRSQTQKVHDWLEQELARGRLIFLRRFDHRVGGDFVFAVRANCPGCERLRGPDRLDPAGFLPDQNLDRMLHGMPTYMNRTFGVVDAPLQNEDVGRALRVDGWALSPSGIRGVDILLDSATKRYRAGLVDRGDVRLQFPWYPGVARPGFTLTIPRRPRGVPKYTDVQVEIIDGTGARTRLPDRMIAW